MKPYFVFTLAAALTSPFACNAGEEKMTTEKATFAGGCFWCMESPFEKIEGVLDVVAGYTGGDRPNPTYEQVCTGTTGHREAVQVTYDPSRVSYDRLLDAFWRQIDPTDPGGQFADRGPQYRSAVFYHNPEQKRLAGKSKQDLARSKRFDKPIVTDIFEAGPFYRAEDYHQDYHTTCPIRYGAYRSGSGRDAFLRKHWGGGPGTPPPAPSPRDRETLRGKLSPMQYEVTRKGGTEPPFDNAYWNNTREGIYVDVISGEPLFSSLDKFDSGTGWPSFTRPLAAENIVERKERGFLMTRTEVRSAGAGSHLGHVFSDGPAPTGLRYCINSASLRFIPKDDLEKEGYGRFKKLFE